MTFFVNGGNPGGGNAYPGVTQTDRGAALAFIRDQMLDGVSGEGWQIGDVDDIGGSETFTIDGTGLLNNKIRMEIRAYDNLKPGHANSAIGVRIRDLDSAGTVTNSEVGWSPLRSVPFENGNTNKIFLAIEEDSLVVCVIPSAGFSCSLFAGYVDRLDETDNMAMYIGYPLTYGLTPTSGSASSEVRISGMWRTHVAKVFESGREWGKVAESVAPGYNYGNTSYANLINHHDPMDMRWYGNVSWESFVNNFNIARGTHLGSGNAYSAKPILMPFFIIETGYKDDDTSNYTDTDEYLASRYLGIVQLACRGYVKNIVRGLAYAGAGVQWQTDSGEIYMSTGAGGWHGMRIA